MSDERPNYMRRRGYDNRRRVREAKERLAVKETREFLQINGRPDATDGDAVDYLIGECGRMPSGHCGMAGSEYCDFECPYS